MSDETTQGSEEESVVEETKGAEETEAVGEAHPEPQEVGESGVLEGGGLVEGEGVTVGVSDDLAVLNERLGYPITESEATDAEDGAVDNDEGVPPEEAPEQPTEASTVPEIKAYLDSQDTSYTSTMNKSELLDLV